MKNQFQFQVITQWNKGAHKNSKTHTSKIEGKAAMQITAAPEFKGEKDKRNPEDLLLSALSSCHMMSYFYVCQQNEIEILQYQDHAVGTLELNADYSGGFSKVVLKPLITLKDPTQKALALSLHERAHQLCFIANSVSFPIKINPVVLN